MYVCMVKIDMRFFINTYFFVSVTDEIVFRVHKLAYGCLRGRGQHDT